MNKSLKFKYLIRLNPQIHKLEEFEKNVIQQGLLINRIKRKDPINNEENTPNERYFEISTESSIPKANMNTAGKIIKNYVIRQSRI